MGTCPIFSVADPAVGPTADDAPAINSAIKAANDSSTGGVIQFGAGPYQLRSRLDPITRSNIVLRGCDSLTTLVAKGSYTGIGNFFKFGLATGSNPPSATNSGMANFLLKIDQGVTLDDPNVFAIEFVNGVGMWASDVVCDGLAGLVKFGSDATSAKRCTVSNWQGDVNRGGPTEAVIFLQNCTGIRVRDVHLNGSLSTPPAGATIKIVPKAGNIVDTAWFTRCAIQINDKPRGVHILRTSGPITNVFFEECNFDNTSVMAVEFVANDIEGANAYTRLLRFTNCRFFGAAGGGFKITNSGFGVIKGIRISGCSISVPVNALPFQLNSPERQTGLRLIGNDFSEASSEDVNVAVKLNGNDWICVNNTVGTVSADGVERVSRAFVIDGEESQMFLMGPNLSAPGILKLTQPTSYTHLPETRQII